MADQKPAREPHEIFDFGGAPRRDLESRGRGPNLSLLRTTHPRVPEGAYWTC
jgi:hypothetical protein